MHKSKGVGAQVNDRDRSRGRQWEGGRERNRIGKERVHVYVFERVGRQRGRETGGKRK